MLRWLGTKKAPQPHQPDPKMLIDQQQQQQQQDEITDDPLATFETNHHGPKPIYSVSRSVLLPRVTLKNTVCSSAVIHTDDRGVNPLFQETENLHQSSTTTKSKPRLQQSGGKSNSSGYGGSNGECSTNLDPIYLEQTKLRDDVITILEQNPNFIKSIRLATKLGRNSANNNSNNNNNNNNNKSVPSLTSGSSTAGGTLTTIPEGRVDLPIPQPIWPQTIDKDRTNYDSIVDDALLFYTTLNNVPDNCKIVDNRLEMSVKEILVELLNNINATMAGNTTLTPEEMLKIVNEKIAASIEALKISTEEEMRKLCINLTNCHKINSVLRAFSNSSSSSGNSSQSSPEWNNNRSRTISSETDDIYQIPSGSSSSGFSDYLKDTQQQNLLPLFQHEDLGNSVTNGVRNAMIYGTLSRVKSGVFQTKSCRDTTNFIKKHSLITINDNKPSVWQQYYGVRAIPEGDIKYPMKPTDVPVYPGGRPEADFTLDLPRSEMLSKRMKQDKKWRCRCRLLTSFLGLVFFLLSVMAVSLMLTRGKRMFGSMM